MWCSPRQAYRMRSLKFHPDRKTGSTAAFQRVHAAFETLSDADKRAAYDQASVPMYLLTYFSSVRTSRRVYLCTYLLTYFI